MWKIENESEPVETIIFGLDAEECVSEIRHRIYLKTKLTASAGLIFYTTFFINRAQNIINSNF